MVEIRKTLHSIFDYQPFKQKEYKSGYEDITQASVSAIERYTFDTAEIADKINGLFQNQILNDLLTNEKKFQEYQKQAQGKYPIKTAYLLHKSIQVKNLCSHWRWFILPILIEMVVWVIIKIIESAITTVEIAELIKLIQTFKKWEIVQKNLNFFRLDILRGMKIKINEDFNIPRETLLQEETEKALQDIAIQELLNKLKELNLSDDIKIKVICMCNQHIIQMFPSIWQKRNPESFLTPLPKKPWAKPYQQDPDEIQNRSFQKLFFVLDTVSAQLTIENRMSVINSLDPEKDDKCPVYDCKVSVDLSTYDVEDTETLYDETCTFTEVTLD